MSRIHQALTRPLPTPKPASGFNPLNGVPRRSGVFWWLVAVIALALAVLLWWSPWRSNDEPAVQALPTTPQAEPALPDALQASLNAMVPELHASLQSLSAEPSDTLALLSSDNATTAIEPTAAAKVEPTIPTPAQVPTTVPTPSPVSSQPTAPEPLPEPVVTEPVVVTVEAAPAAARIDSSVIRVDSHWQSQVQAALADNNLTTAEQTLRAWIDTEPEAAQPRIWLAKLLLSQNRLNAIGGLLVQQESPEALGLLALWHEKSGRPEQAATLFEQVSHVQPDQGAWLLHWAINTENSGQVAQAVLLYHNYLNRFAADNPSLTAFASQRVRSLETP